MNNVKIKAICKKIVFKKDNFSISVFKDENGKEFSLKAQFIPVPESPYNIIAIKDDKSNYADTYNCISISYDLDLRNVSDKDLIIFLSTFTTQRRAENIVKALDNPVDVLEQGDVEELLKVEGVGKRTAERLIEEYRANRDDSADILMLIDYGFSEQLVKSLLSHYGSGQAVVSVLENDVYQLTEVKGIGFKKADQIFLINLKGSPDDIRRVKAYTEYLFLTKFQEGYTWISPSEFVSRFQDDMKACDVKVAINHINESDKYEMFVDEYGNKRLSLTYVSNLERNIISNIYRLNHSKSKVINKNIDECIKKLEGEQGWEYDDSQVSAIHEIENNNVIMIQGLAGTGKSTLVKAYTAAAKDNLYTIRQAALSGKAANNIGTITGMSSQTIHSLLGTDFVNGGFVFHKDNKMFADVIILDELSMVPLGLFYSLIQAIPNGSKLIMLGDYGQLDSIGAGIMKALVQSGAVKVITLDKIHRQAEKSAVITHSLAFRNGKLPEGFSLKPNTKVTYGENKDLTYIMLPDGDSAQDNAKINQHALLGVGSLYQNLITKHDVKDVQIITQTISKGFGCTDDVNRVAQNIYNPKAEGAPVWSIKYSDLEFRVGDRVINTANNRSLADINGADVEIFNGTMGIITDIAPNKSITVDFDDIGEVIMFQKDIQALMLGYAITVHKSQGTTVPVLIYMLGHNFMMNSQEMLYTGITRTGIKSFVITVPKAIKRCVNNSVSIDKNSNLSIYSEQLKRKMEEKQC